MKQWKKIVALLLLVCMTTGQCIAADAASKSSSGYKMTMNKTNYTMKKGSSVQLKVTRKGAAKKKKVVWASSNERVASVSESGKVKAKQNGKASITAKLSGTKVKATCKIVVGTPVKSIKLNKKAVELTIGDSFKLVSTVSPKKPSNKKVVYKSSNKTVATVSAKGEVKALRAGKTKITVTAADGSGKSASCNVMVKEIAVSNVTLDQTNLSLEPGQTARLAASVLPVNATNKNLIWSSSNAGVVTISNGTVRAVGEGNAVITAMASNGVNARCSVKVSYKNKVSNQTELNQALSSRMVTDIVYTSNAPGTINIPSGNYSEKTLEINAPNADVTNNGQFKKVIINQIAKNTYEEHSNNVIYFNAASGHVIVGNHGIATINMNGAGNQSLHLENNGVVNDINIPAKTSLNVEGNNAVPVTLGAGAADSSIVTSTELQITANAKWAMTILPGAENTRAMVDNNNCIPDVAGIGRIPVTINETNDIVNITAEMRDGLGIDMQVNVSGNIQEYYLADWNDEDTSENADAGVDEDTSGSADAGKHVVRDDSEGTKVYILPYTNENSGMDADIYKKFIGRMEASAITGADGIFTIENVRIGNYWVIFEKDNYTAVVKNIMITSSNSDVYTCSNTVLLSNEIAACDASPSISGTVIDGLTGQSVNVSGLQVKLRAGCGNVIGEVLQTAQTDEDGRYEFTNVPAGVYTVEVLDLRQGLAIDAIRYNANNMDIVAANGYLSSDGYNCVVSRKMFTLTGQGRVQFTLTWGNEESGASADIDSHLIGPKADGDGEFHVYYGNRNYYNGEYGDYDDDYDYDDEERMADLDVDDTDWEGPEHTTIYKETDGIYRFYIHNFSEREESNSEMLAKSAVQVQVTIGESSYTFHCPNKKGNLWYVCDYNSVTHSIISKNIMMDFLGDTSDIGMSEEEVYKLYMERQKEYAREDVANADSYLSRFLSNDAKSAINRRIGVLGGQIDAAASKEDIDAVRSRLDQIQLEMEDAFRYPVFSADNLHSKDYDVISEYDEFGDPDVVRPVIYCSVLFGEELVNAAVEADDEGQTVNMERTEEAGYDYVIHVTDIGSGLSYNVWIKTLSNQAESDVWNRVQDCRKLFSQLVENDAVNASKAQLDDILERDISDETSYEEAIDDIQNIYDQYSRIVNKFYIESVSTETDLYDWWTFVSDEEDEDGAWLCQNAVLYLERYDDVTDEEVLAKLNVTFEEVYDEDDEIETITYEIVDSDKEDYSKMIKVTDGVFTKKIYIRVTEW